MKRVNIQAAFVGEPNPGHEGLECVESDEAVLLAVRGGEVTLVVPADTPDDRLVEAARCLRGTLRLDNERVLTFEIHADAIGAYFEDEPAALHQRRNLQPPGDLFSAPGLTPEHARVATIMSTPVVTVQATATARELAELLSYHRISGVPVVGERGELVGIVTEADLMSRAGVTVADLMTRDVVAVTEETAIAEVAALLTTRGIRRVPVVRGDRVVGLVSRADVVRWLAMTGG